jgi:hypothetical protein
MNAKQFNRQYEDLLVEPLGKIGFRAHGQCLSYTKDQSVLALLRFQSRGSGMLRRTHFLLCIRHAFLRTLEKELPTKFLTNASEYPFKLPVSNLSQGMLKSWHYEPINLGPRNYDTIYFGDLTDASEILSVMRDRIMHFGTAWQELLPAGEALEQVKQYGENAYCEKIWIEDYEVFLSRTSLDQRPQTL